MKHNRAWMGLFLALGALLIGRIPAGAQGKKAPLTIVKYKAQCGMVYSAADAKKYHYICPMDHKPLKKIMVSGKATTATLYECAMCGVKSAKPGNCPKCGMKMAKVKK